MTRVAQRRAALPFVLVVVFIDVLGIGIALPVLPMLVGEYTAGRELQAYWYGALVVSYGVMQFVCAPLLGALSDRFGRRPLLLWSMVGMTLNFILLAVAPALWLLFVARVIGGIAGASVSVANAYASDVSAPEQRARSFGNPVTRYRRSPLMNRPAASSRPAEHRCRKDRSNGRAYR